MDFYIDPEGPRGHPGGSGADFGGGKQEFFSCRHVEHMGCEVRKHPGGSGADFGGKQMFFSSRHVERCPLPQRLDLRGAPRGSKEKIDIDHLHVTITSFVVVFKLSFNE